MGSAGAAGGCCAAVVAGGDWGAGVRGGWSAAEGGTSPSCCPCSCQAGMHRLGLGLAALGTGGHWVLADGGTEKSCRDLGETGLPRRKLVAWVRASERPVIPSHRLGHCSSGEKRERVVCINVKQVSWVNHSLLLNAWWMLHDLNVSFKYMCIY